MGFEPTTPTLARLCSTPELHPHPIESDRPGAIEGHLMAESPDECKPDRNMIGRTRKSRPERPAAGKKGGPPSLFSRVRVNLSATCRDPCASAQPVRSRTEENAP